MQQFKGENPSWQFKLAQLLIYNNVKKALGIDQTEMFFYGAAPLDPAIRKYFLSLGIFLINTYGMSESTGPQNFSDFETFDLNNPNIFREVGKNIQGTEIRILKENEKD